MAYNFKNLADVELLNAMPEEANVVVEVNGTTKRAPLPEIPEVDVTAELVGSEALEEVPEGATVLAEVNGQIKRVPSAGLGGGNGVNILLIYQTSQSVGYCTANMTYSEVRALVEAGTPPLPFVVTVGEGGCDFEFCQYGISLFDDHMQVNGLLIYSWQEDNTIMGRDD